MTSYYLVDYENVDARGLSGIEQIKDEDCVIIFYSKGNGQKIPIEIIDKYKDKIKFFCVSKGNQSVDNHLMIYMGYLLGKFPDSRYVIVSKDNGYNTYINTFKKKLNANISRQETISGELLSTKNDSGRQTSNKYAKLRQELMDALNKKVSGDLSDKVIGVCEEHIKDDAAFNCIHTALGSICSQQERKAIWDIIKPVIKKYHAKDKHVNNKNKTNSLQHKEVSETKQVQENEIKSELVKENIDSQIVDRVMIFVKNFKTNKNRKMMIYRSLVSDYGKKNGLELYYRVKEYL